VIHVITSPGPELDAFAGREGVAVHAIPMERAITPGRDLLALWRLWRTLRRIRPDVVHSHTPKGGLLGMMAAALARVPVRVYHIRGLPFMTATGLRRRLLRTSELVSCSLADRVLAVSHSMRTIAVQEGFCPADKVKVLLGGSGNGVDADTRFRPPRDEERRLARAARGIPCDAVVIGFVGRLTRDKGTCELAQAWRSLRERCPRARLLLVGTIEAHDASTRRALSSLRSDPRVHFTGHVADTVPLYAAMDMVALPTYREGFPNVAMEAAAMALPIVATDVPGCRDAVEDGVTGTLVPTRDPVALARGLERYLLDPPLRVRHGESGRRRVLAEFRREAIWEAIAAEYRGLLDVRAPRLHAEPAREGVTRSAPGTS
jgi:glycosyltransferase involved in cell wall biosynthesis